jgi:hypothetical protein
VFEFLKYLDMKLQLCFEDMEDFDEESQGRRYRDYWMNDVWGLQKDVFMQQSRCVSGSLLIAYISKKKIYNKEGYLLPFRYVS